jgi:hypothetical protein
MDGFREIERDIFCTWATNAMPARRGKFVKLKEDWNGEEEIWNKI